ncbi:MAG: peptidoglycan DD-metalloendopeptidase family protein [Magnetococcales bacterium]|nr:peptidoglycan DD-metalloendopeptidase family protein [Magnetococcales bacterium]NGZ27936.1 peptidoglycan DD-metalloendopeptidase family protein [Magnetococcales bacterium]
MKPWPLFLLLMILGQSSLAADDLESSREKLKQIVQQLQKEQSALQSVQDKERSLLDEMELLDRQLDSSTKDLEKVTGKLDEQQKRLPLLELKVATRQEELQRRKQQLGHHLRLVYGLGEPGIVKLAFASDTVHQARQGLRYFGYMVQARQEEYAAFRASLEALNQTLFEQQQAMQQLALLQEELSAFQRQINKERGQKNNLLASLQKDATLREKQIAELKKASTHMSQFVNNLQEQVEKTILQRTSFDNIYERRGKLLPPLSLASKEKGPGLFYAGPVNMPVTAIFRGQVVYADWFRGYGLLIIVDHGDHVYSLYGHNQKLLVAQGDWVEAQEKIATLGETGAVEGAGLYFEIRAKGRPDDPGKWLAKNNKVD